jgi:hypothetical protein
MGSRFSTTGSVYDHGRLCTVNAGHYLMNGVVDLRDYDTSPFQYGWQAYARPLAYIYDLLPDLVPWILEEDTGSAGSRVLIHDSSMMKPEFGYPYTPDENFKFVYNLCAVFPQ